jgi:hypothetical protein
MGWQNQTVKLRFEKLIFFCIFLVPPNFNTPFLILNYFYLHRWITENVEILREVAEFACKNLKRVLDNQ